MFVGACLLGAAALLAAALIGRSAAVGGKWVPMNDAVEAILAESEGADGQANGSVNAERRSAETGNDVGEGGEAGGGGDVVGGTNEGGGNGDVGSGKSNRSNGRGVEVGMGDTGGASETNGFVAESVSSAAGKIDINRANAEQLDGLKGIGPAKAQAIVADREKNGKFQSVDDLLRVKGIGEKLLSSMKESVVALP